MKTQTLSHTSNKGGTGKTTLNVVTAELLAAAGELTLGIDLDPNCSLSETYGLTFSDETSRNLLSGQIVKPYTIKKNLDIIPCDLDMSFLSNVTDMQLKNQLKKQGLLDRYNWIIIDPPGNWCAQTRNAIFAADRLIITGTVSKLDLFATSKYMEQLENCCIDADVKVVCNKYNTKLNAPFIWDQYQSLFKNFLYPIPLPDIKSLKQLTANPSYPMHPSVKGRLAQYVSSITDIDMGGHNHA